MYSSVDTPGISIKETRSNSGCFCSWPWICLLSILLVYVIGWSTVVFGMNSTSNAVRKCKIARGEAECYLLPDCIASAINPKYHSTPSYHRLILHLS